MKKILSNLLLQIIRRNFLETQFQSENLHLFIPSLLRRLTFSCVLATETPRAAGKYSGFQTLAKIFDYSR